MFPHLADFVLSKLFLRKACTYTLPTRAYRTKSSKPLRILFCGSDDFSSASLRALRLEHQLNPALIRSIDVLCRPGKPTGKSLKTIREAPIKAVAQQLGLPVHERDTFREWELPQSENEAINLIVAVSFGLFIPSRIIKAAEYGGLNVHPSLLPQFRGPAPLQHTIMNGETKTGVTLQTLDDRAFDHGLILAQTPGDGVLIPGAAECTYSTLLEFVSSLGADILIQGLRDGVHVPPLQPLRRDSKEGKRNDLIHASKITSNDRRMPFGLEAAACAARLERALGRLWCNVWINDMTQIRLTFEGLSEEQTLESANLTAITTASGKTSTNDRLKEYPPTMDGAGHHKPKDFFVTLDENKRRTIEYREEGNDVLLVLPDNYLRVANITIEGEKKMSAAKALRKIRKRYA